MKTGIVFLMVLSTPAILFAQSLKEFDLQEMPDQGFMIFTDNPNEAAVIIHTAIPTLSFESNTGGLVKTRQDMSKWILFIRPERQIITIQAPGFMELSLSTGLMQAKESKTFRLNSKETNYSPDKGSMVINTQPSRALMTIDGFPDFSQFTPVELKDYEAKPYRIRLEAPNYQPLDTTIVIERGIKQSKLFTLQTTVGFLTLSASRPVKAALNNEIIDITTEPVTHTLPGGIQLLVIREPGYESINETFNLEPGEYLQKVVTLVKLEGLFIFSFLEALDIRIGNQIWKKPAGVQTKPYPPGTYTLSINREGYDPWQQTITLEHKGQLQITPEFTARKSHLVVTVKPEGARVQVTGTGMNRAFLAPVNTGLLPGEYILELSADGYESQTKTVTAGNGKDVSVSVTLKRSAGTPVFAPTRPAEPVETAPPATWFHMIVVGWSNLIIAADNFTEREEAGELEKSGFGLLLGYQGRLGGESSPWVARLGLHCFQLVKTTYGEPIENLYLSALMAGVRLSPFQGPAVDPFFSAGYRQVLVGESAIGLPTGEYLLSHQFTMGIGIEIVPINTSIELNRSLAAGAGLPSWQLSVSGGIRL